LIRSRIAADGARRCGRAGYSFQRSLCRFLVPDHRTGRSQGRRRRFEKSSLDFRVPREEKGVLMFEVESTDPDSQHDSATGWYRRAGSMCAAAMKEAEEVQKFDELAE